jgi:hypothetical protein
VQIRFVTWVNNVSCLLIKNLPCACFAALTQEHVTPLIAAAATGSNETVGLLIAHGAPVSQQESNVSDTEFALFAMVYVVVLNQLNAHLYRPS